MIQPVWSHRQTKVQPRYKSIPSPSRIAFPKSFPLFSIYPRTLISTPPISLKPNRPQCLSHSLSQTTTGKNPSSCPPPPQTFPPQSLPPPPCPPIPATSSSPPHPRPSSPSSTQPSPPTPAARPTCPTQTPTPPPPPKQPPRPRKRASTAPSAHTPIFTENHATFVLNLLVAGLRFPDASAVLGVTWVAGKLVYRYVWVCAGGEGGREREAGGDVVVVAAFGAYGDGCCGGGGGYFGSLVV